MKTYPALPITSKNTSGTLSLQLFILGTDTYVSRTELAKNGDFSSTNMSPADKKRKLRNRRYYLIGRLRRSGYRIYTERRTIVTNFHNLNEIPTPDRFYIRQLLKLGFQQEYSLF